MTSKELHDWVEKKGVPAKWQMPVVQLLRGLLEEERVWPRVVTFEASLLVALYWRDLTINARSNGDVMMFVSCDSGPGSQQIPLGADWVREAIRLAPKKPDTLKEAGIYPCNPFVNYTNEKPAPSRVGGYRTPITPRPTFVHQAWADVFLQSGVVIRAGDLLTVDQSGQAKPYKP